MANENAENKFENAPAIRNNIFWAFLRADRRSFLISSHV